MLQSISHRGPDHVAHYNDHPFHAGMQRLAINGLADGNQPLYSEDKNVVLLYNGEIYNHTSLKKTLINRGHVFHTHSDGEVICHLYEEKGVELFNELDGMFALALWIKSERKLILARDYIGEKPLYYMQPSSNELVFASEIKALSASKACSLTLNHQAIWDFPTFLWIPEPHTIYDQIHALPPGSFLIFDGKTARIHSYFNPKNVEALPLDFSQNEINLFTQDIINQSVQSRLLSEVPVGCFLSGGLDSSIVTTIAAQSLDSVNTYSIGFDDYDDPFHGKSDESKDAEYLANILGTKHSTIHASSRSFKELLPLFCHHGDQPFAVSSGLGILKIAQTAHHDNIKVLLSGDGADEFFGGYSWYALLHATQTLPFKNKNTLSSFQSIGLSTTERMHRIAQYPRSLQAWAWHYYAHEQTKEDLFNQNWYRSTSLSSSIRHFSDLDNLNSTQFPMAFLEHDRSFYFPNEMLTKVDRMCMAYSVESRVPFASKAATNWARSLPYSALIKENSLKHPLRMGFSGILPSEVLSRPKHGFNVPIEHWLKGDWKDLLDHAFSEQSALSKHGFISSSSKEKAIQMLNDPMTLNGHTLFCYIMLNMWLENEHNRNYS